MRRAVFDSGVVLSAQVYGGRLLWLRDDWSRGTCCVLYSADTLIELRDLFSRAKYRLHPDLQAALISEYLLYSEEVVISRRCLIFCRDPDDQIFLDVAESGDAEVLVSGDLDILALAGQTRFAIERPAAYEVRVLSDEAAQA